MPFGGGEINAKGSGLSEKVINGGCALIALIGIESIYFDKRAERKKFGEEGEDENFAPIKINADAGDQNEGQCNDQRYWIGLAVEPQIG